MLKKSKKKQQSIYLGKTETINRRKMAKKKKKNGNNFLSSLRVNGSFDQSGV